MLEETKNIFRRFLIKESKAETESMSMICLTLEDLIEAGESDSCNSCHWYNEDFSGRANIGTCFRNPPHVLIKDNLTYSARPKVLATDRPCIKFKKIKT